MLTKVAAPLVVAMLSPLPALTAWPLHAHPPTVVDGGGEKAVAEEIEDFRKRVAKAVADRDDARVREAFAKTFRHTLIDGQTENRDERVARLLAGQRLIEIAHTHRLEIRAHAGGWAAVAFGESQIDAQGTVRSPSRQGAKTSAGRMTVRWTATFVRNGESWQIAASQENRVGVDAAP